MKKIAIALFSISVFAGVGYLVFANTPLGKNSLTKWLLKKWNEAAKKKKKELDNDKLKSELKKLKYNDLELLVAYTWTIPVVMPDSGIDKKKEKKIKNILEKIKEAKILKRADLSQLDNIVLPG
jgi:hypothetical protein